MEWMRSLTVALIALILGAGVLPAVAESGTSPDPSGSPSPTVSGSPSVSPSASPSPTPSATPNPQVYPVFNYPGPGLPDPSLNSELVRLLDLTPADATITASFFVIQPNYPVVDALINAHGRGAGVRVVLDSGDGQSPSTNEAVDASYARLAAALGNDPAAPSFAMQCGLACISKADKSINHNKFVTMSQAGDLQDVVFQSTANVRSDGSGDAAWNAAVVTSGNPEVMAQYESYFNDLAARRSVPGNNYHAVRPPMAYGASTPYYFPRTDGGDSLSQALMAVDCAAAPTSVDVMAAFFTRPKVRNRLNDMAAGGCTVRVIARTDTITREFCDTLRAPIQVKIADKPSTTKVGIHGKYLTIAGGFEGETDRRVVWMGSHNLTRNALVRNDETFLLTDDASLHSAFTTNFDAIWSYPSLTPGCDRAGAPSEQAIEEEANTEVTPLIKEKQRVKRKLPKRLKKRRTALKSTRTVEGTRLRTIAKCKVVGSGKKMKKRKICVIRKPKTNPTLVLSKPKRTLKVRITQKAKGSATLLRFERSKKYTRKAKK